MKARWCSGQAYGALEPIAKKPRDPGSNPGRAIIYLFYLRLNGLPSSVIC